MQNERGMRLNHKKYNHQPKRERQPKKQNKSQQPTIQPGEKCVYCAGLSLIFLSRTMILVWVVIPVTWYGAVCHVSALKKPKHYLDSENMKKHAKILRKKPLFFRLFPFIYYLSIYYRIPIFWVQTSRFFSTDFPWRTKACINFFYLFSKKLLYRIKDYLFCKKEVLKLFAYLIW